MEKPSDNYILISIVFILFLFSSNTFSQSNDSLTVFQHDNAIVVTATRTEKKASDVSRSISLITKDDIRNSVYISPIEALSEKAGLFFIGNGQNPGSAQNIFMRGVNSNSTAVMIDGMRITDPTSIENSINFAEMSLMNIEQIEVIRGSHSTLYGSSAIGGVINFITDKNRAVGFNADFSTQVGSFGTGTSLFNQSLFMNYTFENGFYINGEIFNSKINGIDATINIIPDSLKFKSPDKDNFEKLENSIKTGFINNDWDIFMSYKKTNQKADIDAGAFADDDNAFLKYNRSLLTYSTKYKFNDAFNISLNGGYSDMTRTSIDDSSLINNLGDYDQTYTSGVYKGSTLNNEIQINYKAKNMSVLIGAGYNYEEMTSKNYTYSNSIWGVYEAQSNLDSLNINAKTQNLFSHFDLNGGLIGEKFKGFNLAFGGRYINHSTFNSIFTYEINPSYKFENGLLYGALSTGYNAPSLYRLFTPELNFSSGITRGNADLKPEESLSLEFGYRHYFSKTHSLFITLFNNKIRNIHEYVYLWNSDTQIDSLSFFDDRGDTYINAGTMTTNGVEIGFSSKISTSLSVSGNASWVYGKQKYSLNDIDTKHTQGNHVQVFNNGVFITKDIEVEGLARRSNTANVSIKYSPFTNFAINSQIHYVGKRDDVFYNLSIGPYGSLDKIRIANYTLLNLNFRYKFVNLVQLNLRLENVLDKKYSEIRGYSTKGRSLYLALHYSL